MQVWDVEQWVKNFWVHKTVFLDLYAELSPAIQHKDIKLRAALTGEKSMAITLWKLAMLDWYWSVRNDSGVGKSTGGLLLRKCAGPLIIS